MEAGHWPTATSGSSSAPQEEEGPGVQAELNLCAVHGAFPCRGGGERGLAWHRAARREGKSRGVDDLRTCLLFLFSSGVSSPSLTALTACSAGAVPVGALCNRHPHLMRAISLQVCAQYI